MCVCVNGGRVCCSSNVPQPEASVSGGQKPVICKHKMKHNEADVHTGTCMCACTNTRSQVPVDILAIIHPNVPSTKGPT